MKKTIKYFIYEDYRLVIEIIQGPIALIDYFKMKEIETQDPRYDPSFNFILDIREADFVIAHSAKGEIDKYISFAKSTPNLVGKRKSALLTKTPDQVVAMTLYKLSNSLPLTLEIFSTYQAALTWLGIEGFNTDKEELKI